MKSIIKCFLILAFLFSFNRTELLGIEPNTIGIWAKNSLKNENSRKFLVGPTIGYGLATCRFDYPGKAAPPMTSFKPVPNAGLSIDWRIAKSLSLDLDFKYFEKGYKINMNQWVKDINDNDPEGDDIGSSSAEGYTTMKLSYAEMSIYPIIVIANKLEIGAGGFLAYGLNGKRISDYKIIYNWPELSVPDETFQTEKEVEFVDIFPSSVEDSNIYINRFDYGLTGHLGFRINPFKISLGVNYSINQWEPDSKLSGLFLESFEHTYNIAGFLTVSWFPGAN